MTRPDYCPVGGEPCQSMCAEPCKWWSAEIDRWKAPYRRAINEANGLTNYVEDRPELRSAERRIAEIEGAARAARAALAQQAQPAEMSPEFTDTARAALAWVLWHHQGGSSKVGQAMRFALGMGDHERMSEYQVAEAKRWGALAQPSTERKPLHGYELAKVVADAGAPELNSISASAVLSLIRAIERAHGIGEKE